mmetsp:Transcript_35525/g.36194  ORF Transcript_35525/g.36194 Transcript_35525/m.36194 type:complete len:180 (+) Transcript_35525:166-705(+)|eukprot:CAMPEP_0182419274 /NCGR_PEP_ID=MMETSP1167-20130531/3724_1 /TAXON_ID=2988 /ORGANISM="Mallomonas Sp, Strain CCMP3275" /LENGTH=179 /DNA_ID=CAMNT_0024594067 /DNA_START=115 /DNA_END=654 /DNA_ORIENTATION=-
MDFLNSSEAITSLSTILQESNAANQSGTEQVPPMALTPTTIVQNSGDKAKVKADKAIWNDSEIPSEDALTDLTDKRPCPKYEISYKQTVGTEDTFLGMSDITPASSDCTELVVKIHFPGSTMKDLDLDVTKNRIKAESRTLKLFTYLPMPVKHDDGTAKFDPKKEVLTVILPIDNELDS